jgi:LuxR family maltose regulon positive regulatory protein
LGFQRKRPGKPIQLLQAMIALGGREVGIGTLEDLLWPDSEGDGAGNAFHVTLLRLRRMLGDAALTLSDHRVSLNDRYCLVDASVLERLVTRSETEQVAEDGRCAEARRLAEQALVLY